MPHSADASQLLIFNLEDHCSLTTILINNQKLFFNLEKKKLFSKLEKTY